MKAIEVTLPEGWCFYATERDTFTKFMEVLNDAYKGHALPEEVEQAWEGLTFEDMPSNFHGYAPDSYGTDMEKDE